VPRRVRKPDHRTDSRDDREHSSRDAEDVSPCSGVVAKCRSCDDNASPRDVQRVQGPQRGCAAPCEAPVPQPLCHSLSVVLEYSTRCCWNHEHAPEPTPAVRSQRPARRGWMTAVRLWMAVLQYPQGPQRGAGAGAGAGAGGCAEPSSHRRLRQRSETRRLPWPWFARQPTYRH